MQYFILKRKGASIVANFRFSFTWIDILISMLIFLASCSIENGAMKHKYETIDLKEYYDGKGAIFPPDSGIVPVAPGWRRSSLTVEQIKRAEEILKSDMGEFMKRMLIKGKIHLSGDLKTIEDTTAQLDSFTKAARKDVREYYRQYIGFINDKDQKIVEINLFNFDTPEGRRLFKKWRDEYILGADGYYTENTVRYFVNIDRGRIE
jgi:hypothetical protein